VFISAPVNYYIAQVNYYIEDATHSDGNGTRKRICSKIINSVISLNFRPTTSNSSCTEFPREAAMSCRKYSAQPSNQDPSTCQDTFDSRGNQVRFARNLLRELTFTASMCFSSCHSHDKLSLQIAVLRRGHVTSRALRGNPSGLHSFREWSLRPR
jgi:hypothetical protein